MKLICPDIETIRLINHVVFTHAAGSGEEYSEFVLEQRQGAIYWHGERWSDEYVEQIMVDSHNEQPDEKDMRFKRDEELHTMPAWYEDPPRPWIRKKNWEDARAFMEAVLSFKNNEIKSEWKINPLSNLSLQWSIPEDLAIEGIRLFEEGAIAHFAILLEDNVFVSDLEWLQEVEPATQEEEQSFWDKLAEEEQECILNGKDWPSRW